MKHVNTFDKAKVVAVSKHHVLEAYGEMVVKLHALVQTRV
jgi:hypothetical protein